MATKFDRIQKNGTLKKASGSELNQAKSDKLISDLKRKNYRYDSIQPQKKSTIVKEIVNKGPVTRNNGPVKTQPDFKTTRQQLQEAFTRQNQKKKLSGVKS